MYSILPETTLKILFHLGGFGPRFNLLEINIKPEGLGPCVLSCQRPLSSFIPFWGFWSTRLTCQKSTSMYYSSPRVLVHVFYPARDHSQSIIPLCGFWSTRFNLTEITIKVLFQCAGLGTCILTCQRPLLFHPGCLVHIV